MNKQRIYCGIDPGSEGAMCIMWPSEQETPFDAFTPGQITTLSFKDENPHKIADMLRVAISCFSPAYLSTSLSSVKR